MTYGEASDSYNSLKGHKLSSKHFWHQNNTGKTSLKFIEKADLVEDVSSNDSLTVSFYPVGNS